jgi:hypothetical protein
LNNVVELDKKALASYKNLDMPAALALFDQALALCKEAHLEGHAVSARTHLHLGVVYVSGIKKRALGVAEFRKAIGIDPRMRIAKSLLNPEVQSAFEEALIAGGLSSVEQNPAPFPAGQQADEAAAGSAPPSRGVTGLYHPLVTEAGRGKPVEIKVQVSPELEAAKIVLAYLGKGSGAFLAREMTPLPGAPGWYHESIPTEATQGTRVAYYLGVENADEVVVAHSGTPDQPHRITLISAAEATVPAKAATGGATGLWFVLAVGTGGGYYAGSPELNPHDRATPPATIRVSGVARAQLLHFAPEIGYFHSPRWVVSMQGRFQIVTGTEDVLASEPATWAAAGLAKVTRLLRREGDRFRPFLSAQAGIGQIRHSITTPSEVALVGCGAGTTCKDAVVGGLGLAGAGVGFTFKLNGAFAVYAAFNALAGFPNLTVNGDLNLGVAMVK